MRTRVVWLILLALVAVTALSGCGGGSSASVASNTDVVAPPGPSKEEIIQQHLEGRELDPIEGVWLWDTGEYEAAVFKGTDSRFPGYEYVGVVTTTTMPNWGIGEVKVALKKTASENHYAVAYYLGNKTLGKTIATLTNGTVLEMNVPQVGRVALVKIYPIKGKETAKPARMGAGFFVTKDVVATNYHLIADAQEVSATFGGTRLGVKLLAGDKVNDLALLKVEFPGDEVEKNQLQAKILPLALGEVRSVKQGDKVYAGGFPPDGDVKKGVGVFETTLASTAALGGDPRLFQVNMPVLPLNVGGPLLTVHGEVIGVTTSTANNAYLGVKKESLPAGVNLVVKANYLANLLYTLPPEATPGPSPAGGELTSAQLADRLSSALVLIEAKD